MIQEIINPIITLPLVRGFPYILGACKAEFDRDFEIITEMLSDRYSTDISKAWEMWFKEISEKVQENFKTEHGRNIEFLHFNPPDVKQSFPARLAIGTEKGEID